MNPWRTFSAVALLAALFCPAPVQALTFTGPAQVRPLLDKILGGLAAESSRAPKDDSAPTSGYQNNWGGALRPFWIAGLAGLAGLSLIAPRIVTLGVGMAFLGVGIGLGYAPGREVDHISMALAMAGVAVISLTLIEAARHGWRKTKPGDRLHSKPQDPLP